MLEIDAPRNVKPRKRGFRYMRIAAVYDGRIWDDVTVTDDLAGYVYSMRHHPTVFVTDDASYFMRTLIAAYGGIAGEVIISDWTYQFTRVAGIKGDEASLSRVHCKAFGFRSSRERLHQLWDITAMTSTITRQLIAPPVTAHKLYTFGIDVRNWAQDNDLELRGSLAGYAAQLLRDKRFYREPRRQVPRSTNDKARHAVTGNRTELLFTPELFRTYHVASIDQRSAHHRIVQDIPLPDANSLYARGYFRETSKSTALWARRGTAIYNRTVGQAGLIYVGLWSRRTLPGEFRLRCQDFDGYRRVWLWTNTIGFVESHGSHIDGIIGAWTAKTADTGLPRFGAWAQTQIESAAPERKQWLKPTLHCTYGLLAAHGRPFQTGTRTGTGTPMSFFMLGAEIPVMAGRVHNWTPKTVNVTQRGMIEAETEIRTLLMAERLTALHHFRVLHIQTDGLHVTGSNGNVDIPWLRETSGDRWRIDELTDVMYLDDVSWIANENACLPGRDQHKRLAAIEQYRRIHGSPR